jgi:hypothetical protein
MAHFLSRAIEEGVLTFTEAKVLSDDSLRLLLPSASGEASEEGGVGDRPDPEYVLTNIHKCRTGTLFQFPLLGPERIEYSIDKNRLAMLKEGLGDFGLGFQVIDDIRDMARDYIEERHNYLLSVLVHRDGPRALDFLQGASINDNVLLKVPDVAEAAALRGYALVSRGLSLLDEAGIHMGSEGVATVTQMMFKALRVDEALQWVQR